MTCSVEGCTRRSKCKTLCGTHYERLRISGSVADKVREVRLCFADECIRPHFCKGYCTLHYGRLNRIGALELTPRPSLRNRILMNVEPDDNGCWIWQGQPMTVGYGFLSFGGAQIYAHRAAYEALVGPIPEDLTIDHLCMVRMCVNPQHLEPVTRAENTRRELQARYNRKAS